MPVNNQPHFIIIYISCGPVPIVNPNTERKGEDEKEREGPDKLVHIKLTMIHDSLVNSLSQEHSHFKWWQETPFTL